MQLAWEHLLSLPVQTQSGQKLGVIEGVAVETEHHHIVHYQVKPSTILAGLFKKPFLISPEQVLSCSNKIMIVSDSVAATDPVTTKKQTRLASASAHSELDL